MDKTETTGIIRGTINGKAKYCRIPVRSKLYDAIQDGGELNANAILAMPRKKATKVIDAIVEDWMYWMRRAGELFVEVKALEAIQNPADGAPERAGRSPAPADLLGLGDTVWMKYYDDDLGREAIEEVRVTGLGYEGFWYSASPDRPRAMEALVQWDRFGVDAFFSREEAERE